MSWGVVAFGKAPAVLTDIARQFAAGGKCVEPEEGVRQAAAAVLGTAIAAQDPRAIIKVSASGHQSTDYTTHVTSNNLTINVEALHGFLE